MSNPPETDAAKPAANGVSKPSQDWPTLVESGAGLSEADRGGRDPLDAPIERLPPEKFSLTAEVKKRPMLFIGLGALALGGVAAIVGRKALFRAAAPMLVKAATRNPAGAVKLAARHPKATYRLIAMGVEPTISSGVKTVRGLPQKVRDLDLPQRVKDLELQQRLHDIEATLVSSLQAVRELPRTVRDKVAHRG